MGEKQYRHARSMNTANDVGSQLSWMGHTRRFIVELDCSLDGAPHPSIRLDVKLHVADTGKHVADSMLLAQSA
jgi:hypothetical protein